MSEMPQKIEVVQIITKDGGVFFNECHGPDVMREVMSRCEWRSMVRLEMDRDCYLSLPVSVEAAELFKKES